MRYQPIRIGGAERHDDVIGKYRAKETAMDLQNDNTHEKPGFSKPSYILVALLGLTLLWLCVFVPALNPIKLDGVFSDISFYHYYRYGTSFEITGDTVVLDSDIEYIADDGNVLSDRVLPLLAASLFAVAFLYILQLLSFVLTLPKGRAVLFFKWTGFLSGILLALFFIPIAALMAAMENSLIGSILSFAACFMLSVNFLRCRYSDPPVVPSAQRSKRALHPALLLAVVLLTGAFLWLMPRIAPVSFTQHEHDDIFSPALPIGGDRKPGVYTFILSGFDVGLRTDTLMVCALDTHNNTLQVVSIPRDTMTDASARHQRYRSVPKINGAYLSGFDAAARTGARREDRHSEGIRMLRTEIRGLLGFVPDYYVMIHLNAFIELVDAVGGVEYNVPHNMFYEDRMQTPPLLINLTQGRQRLDGDKALQLVRYRGGRGDIGRVGTTQSFLNAFAEQASGSVSPATVGSVIQILENPQTVLTDISGPDLLGFMTELIKVQSENIHFHIMPHRFVNRNGSYALAQSDELIALLNETINPYTQRITSDNLHLRS
jgi:LCP family protein required for cell wall assembly